MYSEDPQLKYVTDGFLATNLADKNTFNVNLAMRRQYFPGTILLVCALFCEELHFWVLMKGYFLHVLNGFMNFSLIID